jgi:acetyl esterase/lipase
MLMTGPLSRRWRAFVVAGLSLLGAAACGPLGLLDAVTPAGSYQTHPGIAYGPDPRQRLDVYVPERPGGKRPVIIFFYGGNWQQGDRADYRFVAESLTRADTIVVIPDYRLYPAVTFPGFVEDSARAVAWAAGNIARYGGDPGRIFLIGHSAGAYNAAMVALDPRYLQAAGGSRAGIAGVIGIAGPYDFLPLTDPTLQVIFGPEPVRARTQPINFVDSQAPPMLLVTGTEDTVVQPRNTQRLASRLRDAGVPVREILYPRLGHIEIVLGLSSRLRGDSTLPDDISAFMRR